MGLNSGLPPVPAICLFALRSGPLLSLPCCVLQGPGAGEGEAFSRWVCPLVPGYAQPVGGAGSRWQGRRKGEARVFQHAPCLCSREGLQQPTPPASPAFGARGSLAVSLSFLPFQHLCQVLCIKILPNYWLWDLLSLWLRVQYRVLNVWDSVTWLCNYCYNSANLEITQNF